MKALKSLSASYSCCQLLVPWLQVFELDGLKPRCKVSTPSNVLPLPKSVCVLGGHQGPCEICQNLAQNTAAGQQKAVLHHSAGWRACKL